MIKRARTSKRIIKPKVGKCAFCVEKTLPNWKDADELNKYLSERGRILGRDRTGICAKHQRRLTKAIKQCRHLGLLPFIVSAK